MWDAALRDGLTIVTKDRDFADPVRFPGPPPQSVRLSIGNADPDELETYLREHTPDIEAFAASGERYREI
ncbi:MAG: DUF5615 family PIN-like protein [Chloroflexi bacterium]|nr:DUF5615 family PIN-like protein [Chloroflexota bacterium]